MKILPLRRIMPAALLLCVAFVQAQPPSSTQPTNPNDPSVAVPAIRFRSSFEGYRTLRDEPVTSWKDSNELVGRIGGWRVYAREAGQIDEPAVGSSSSEPKRPATNRSSNQSGTQQSVPPKPDGPGGAAAGHGGHK